jgi:hypothetical protein
MGFRKMRVHDLKHTFGPRPRAAGVSFEDRQDLLGHKSGRITTHYSAAELSNLISASEKVCEGSSRNSPTTPDYGVEWDDEGMGKLLKLLALHGAG